MKVKYKYIYFEVLNEEKGKAFYECYTNKENEVLGEVYFDNSWKVWVFEPHNKALTIFNASCLRDIADFMDQL